MRDPVIHYREQAARKKLPPTNRSSLSCPFSPLLQIFIPPPHGPAVNGREKRSFPPPTIGAPSPTEEQACVLQSTIGGCFHRSSPSHLAPFNNFGERGRAGGYTEHALHSDSAKYQDDVPEIISPPEINSR